jgi:hypothetical protein
VKACSGSGITRTSPTPFAPLTIRACPNRYQPAGKFGGQGDQVNSCPVRQPCIYGP